MSTRVPRMTAREARQDKPHAPRCAVAFERLQSVCGAGRVETAVHTEQRAQNRSDNSGSRAITVCSRRSHQASLDFRQYNCTYGQANQNIAASKSRLLGSKQLPQQALHPVAVDCARKTRLGTMRPSLGTPSRFALNSTLNPGCLSARPPESNAAISAAPSRCLRP